MLALGGRCLLRLLWVRVDLVVLAGSVAGLLLASAVVHDPGYHRGSGIPSLVLNVLLEMVDGRLLPDIVDRREARPCWRSILKMSEESIDAVLLGCTPSA